MPTVKPLVSGKLSCAPSERIFVCEWILDPLHLGFGGGMSLSLR
jgi:hypothetical protein